MRKKERKKGRRRSEKGRAQGTLLVVDLAVAFVQGGEQFHFVLVLHAQVALQSAIQLLHSRYLSVLLRQLISQQSKCLK